MRLRLLLLTLLSTGCSSGLETAADPRDAADAPDDAATVVTRVQPMPDGAISGYCASEPEEAVRGPIVVSPRTLTLKVGDATSLLAFATASAESDDRVPTMVSVDSPIARVENGSVLALAPGRAGLEFRPLCAAVEDDPETVPVAVVDLVIEE